MVELDGGVVDISRAHMPEISDGAFDDPRTNLIIGDGAKFAAETDQRFDVIMIDSTDPQGPGEVLFSKTFYADCKRCLNPGGILVTQNGVPFSARPGIGRFRHPFPQPVRGRQRLFDHRADICVRHDGAWLGQ